MGNRTIALDIPTVDGSYADRESNVDRKKKVAKVSFGAKKWPETFARYEKKKKNVSRTVHDVITI